MTIKTASPMVCGASWRCPTENPEGLGAYEGTSMATPHVAAAIALAIAARAELKRNPDAIAQAVEAAGVNPPEGGCSAAKALRKRTARCGETA